MAGEKSAQVDDSEWLQKHRVAPHLPSLFYLPEFVPSEEEERLLREVRASKAKWVQLSGRRLQNYGGVVHAKGLIPAPLPSWLQPVLKRLGTDGDLAGMYGGKPPNHVLVNSYNPGEGIMPHEDGPAYHPVVAILSLGAPAVLRFRSKQRLEGGGHDVTRLDDEGASQGTEAFRLLASVLLQPRSLVVFREQAFTDCLHGIDEVQEELLDESVANLDMYGISPGVLLSRGGERISLTVRRVQKELPAILRPTSK